MVLWWHIDTSIAAPIVRPDTSFTSTSCFQRDTTSVVRPDAKLSSTPFLRRDVTSVVRSDAKLSSISFFRRDATLVVRPDSKLSSTFFLRRDVTSVARPDTKLSSASFLRRDYTPVARPGVSVLAFLSLWIYFCVVSRWDELYIFLNNLKGWKDLKVFYIIVEYIWRRRKQYDDGVGLFRIWSRLPFLQTKEKIMNQKR